MPSVLSIYLFFSIFHMYTLFATFSLKIKCIFSCVSVYLNATYVMYCKNQSCCAIVGHVKRINELFMILFNFLVFCTNALIHYHALGGVNFSICLKLNEYCFNFDTKCVSWRRLVFYSLPDLLTFVTSLIFFLFFFSENKRHHLINF